MFSSLSSIVLFGFNMNMNYCITISSNALRFFADAVPAGKPMGNRATAFTIFLFYLFDVLVVYLVALAELPQAVSSSDSHLRHQHKRQSILIQAFHGCKITSFCRETEINIKIFAHTNVNITKNV